MSRATDLFDAAKTAEAHRRNRPKEKKPESIPIKDLRKELDALINLFESPIPVPGDARARTTLARTIWNICLEKWRSPKISSLTVDQICDAGTKERLAASFETVSANALRDLEKSGAYATAFPDPTASTSIFSAAKGYPVACPGTVSSVTGRMPLDYAVSKGVSAMAFAVPLARKYDFGDRVQSGYENFAERGFLYEVLAEVDREKADRCRAIIERCLNRTPKGYDVSAGEKVLIIPCGAGYVQITPVYSQGLAAATTAARRALNALEDQRIRLPTRTLTYGGGNAQNVGLVSNALSGNHEMLSGFPPRADYDPARIERERIRSAGTLLLRPDAEKMARLAELDSPLLQRNCKRRDQFENALYDVVHSVTEAFRQSDSQIDAVTRTKLPAVEVEIHATGFDKAAPRFRQAFVEHVSRHIAVAGRFNIESAIVRRWLERKVEAAMVGSGQQKSTLVLEPAE